jgi:hypothetical protein
MALLCSLKRQEKKVEITTLYHMNKQYENHINILNTLTAHKISLFILITYFDYFDLKNAMFLFCNL